MAARVSRRLFTEASLERDAVVLSAAGGQSVRLPWVELRAVRYVGHGLAELATEHQRYRFAADNAERREWLAQVGRRAAEERERLEAKGPPAWLVSEWVAALPAHLRTTPAKRGPHAAVSDICGCWVVLYLAVRGALWRSGSVCWLDLLPVLFVLGVLRANWQYLRSRAETRLGVKGISYRDPATRRRARIPWDQLSAVTTERGAAVLHGPDGASVSVPDNKANAALLDAARRAVALRAATLALDLDEPPPDTALSRALPPDEEAERGVSLVRD